MAINKTMRKIMKALSFDDVKVTSSRNIANLKAINPMKIFYNTLDYAVLNGDYSVPMRVYLPNEDVGSQGTPLKALVFFHGGGWVTDSVENYNRVCASMARSTGYAVISVEYRLAPEHKFPTGLYDCYAAVRALFEKDFILNIDPKDVVLIGDSAGGNLAAALSLMARDRGEFIPRCQILIYPAVNNDYSETSEFGSVHENGEDFVLTASRIRQYQEYYKSCDEDLQNPYFAPILSADLSNQPRTLIITAQYDPLRDEGEEYGRRLSQAGNEVEIYRINNAIHGFFGLGIKHYHVQESFEIINHFLREC